MRPSTEVVVADAGPLIALARLELLGMPARLFARVMVTSTVLAECEAKPDRGEGPAIRAALEQRLLQVVDGVVPAYAWGIDAGEASAIAVALELGAAVLIDDKAGRSVAAHLGCRMLGTAGLLVLAKRKGLLEVVGPQLHRLRKSGYFLGDAVIADALRLAGE